MPALTAHRRPYRWLRGVAAAGTLLVTGLVPLIGSSPAGATNAPLQTTDGLGVRVDEDVVVGPLLEATETELQPLVDQALHDAAEALVPPNLVTWIDVTSNVELSVDFVDAGTSGFPDGGVKAEAAIDKLEIHYLFDNLWWWPTCDLWVIPDATTARATAVIDRDPLPDSPLPFGVAGGDWDSDPDIFTTGSCSPYLGYGYDDLFENGVADVIEADVTARVQDAFDDVWTDHVIPVLDGLTGGFGIGFGQVRTDDHGLVVTGDVDASAGLTIPGFPSGPWSVANAADAGVTSDVDVLLAERVDGAIVTIHPNVANQLLYALTRSTSGLLTGATPVSAAIEDLLLKAAVHGNYDDGGWTVALSAVGSTTAPSAHPTGPDGAPELRFDPIDLTVWNTSHTPGPVAIFRGSITDTYDPGAATVNLSLFYGNSDVVDFGPDPAAMTPYARDAVADHAASFFAGYPSLGPTTLGTLTWCSACPRYDDDQRYTATLLG
jgi:hypothetical protein